MSLSRSNPEGCPVVVSVFSDPLAGWCSLNWTDIRKNSYLSSSYWQFIAVESFRCITSRLVDRRIPLHQTLLAKKWPLSWTNAVMTELKGFSLFYVNPFKGNDKVSCWWHVRHQWNLISHSFQFIFVCKFWQICISSLCLVFNNKTDKTCHVSVKNLRFEKSK